MVNPSHDNILTVTTNLDENDGGFGGSGLSLRDALIYAHNNNQHSFRIQLQAGATYNLTQEGSREQFGLTGDLDIFGNRNITIETINGDEKAIINAGTLIDKDSVFHVRQGSTLTLDNITVTGGQQVDSLGLDGKGGGIFISGESSVTLIDSLLTQNTAVYGGGVAISSGNLQLENSSISGNTALEDGGGIYAKEEGLREITLDFDHSAISDNTANGEGGGIYSQGGVVIDIQAGSFENNTSTGGFFAGGGAIFAQGENSDRAQVTISDNSLFQENVADNANLGGGAIYGEIADIIINQARFVDNRLTGDKKASGAAIYATDYSDLNINEALFDTNINETPSGSGGAIVANNQTNATITYSLFSRNLADYGGAVSTRGNVEINNVLFQQNQARVFGGAASINLGGDNNSPHTATILNSDFVQNKSQGNGGAVRLRGSKDNRSEWQTVNFINNEATGTNNVAQTEGHGGAIAVYGGDHHLEDVTISDNIAKEKGGGIYFEAFNNATSIDISKSEISRNQGEDGGGIYGQSNRENSADLTFEQVNLKHNTAEHIGGGVRLIDGIDVLIKESQVVNNMAGIGGGGGSFEGVTLDVLKSQFLHNQANHEGGGIRMSAPRFLLANKSPGVLNLAHSLISGNTTRFGKGGGLLLDPSTESQISNSVITRNSAAINGAALYVAASFELLPAAKVDLLGNTIAYNVAHSNNNGTENISVYVAPGNPNAMRIPTEDGELRAYNNIFAHTVIGEENNPTGFDLGGAIPVALENNLIQNPQSVLGLSTSNIVGVDPLFQETNEDGVYALTSSSVAINTGDESFLPPDTWDLDNDGDTLELIELDYLLNPRVIGDFLDLGALEFQTVNNSPTDLVLNNTNIDKNQPINTTVGTFTTSDPDIGETFTYNLVTGEGDTHNNLFTIIGNSLKTNTIFNYESQNSYSIRVQTTDSDHNIYSEAFTINVNDLIDELMININGATVNNSLERYGDDSVFNGNRLPQDTDDAVITYLDNGNEVKLENNAWKRLHLGNYTVTENTVLSFEFLSTDEGEINGIGLDNDDNIFDDPNTANDESQQLFQLYGSQSFGEQAFNNYNEGDGWKTYTIDVGNYYTGDYQYLVFSNDQDGNNNQGSSSQFRNIFLEEVTPPPTTEQLTVTVNGMIVSNVLERYGDASVFNGNPVPQDTDEALVTYLNNGNEVQLENNTWKSLDITGYTVTDNTSLSFQFRSDEEAEIQGIGFDNDDDLFNNTNTIFQLYGTQTFANQAFNDYEGLNDVQAVDGWKDYSINLGQYFTGEYDRLVFVNDNDTVDNLGGAAQFRNIVLSEIGSF
ncbi:MAG: hypothetical protein AB4062_18270 [Crocosphaera sp.]